MELLVCEVLAEKRQGPKLTVKKPDLLNRSEKADPDKHLFNYSEH